MKVYVNVLVYVRTYECTEPLRGVSAPVDTSKAYVRWEGVGEGGEEGLVCVVCVKRY